MDKEWVRKQMKVMKAFPNNRSEGMELRDYFAAKAMQSLLLAGGSDASVSAAAYEIADALMEARELHD